MADSAVREILDKLNVKHTSKILNEKIRDPETNDKHSEWHEIPVH